MAIDQNKNQFPVGPLLSYETELISELCGGKPLTRPRGVEFFFQVAADPVLVRGRLKYLLPTVGYRSAGALDVNTVDGTRAFMRGARFYAGVFDTVRGLGKIPCLEVAVRDLANGDERFWLRTEPATCDVDLANVVLARVIREAGSFCELMDEASQALEIDTAQKRQLALVGAGVVHAIAKDSLAYAAGSDLTILESLSGLDDLQDIFARVDSEFGNA